MTDSRQVDRFIAEQLGEWKQAADNYAALAGVKVKDLDVDGMHIRTQFNPARAVSSAAKVDSASLKARKCFLCGENRPGEQRGIDWNSHYTILVNPFPIFPRHLTIPEKEHTDQLISGRISDMIKLAQELDEYTVFYNGPRCGASAPDHMHFQAGNSDFLTIAENLEGAELQTVAIEGDSVLSLVTDMPLKVFVIDAASAEDGQKLFERLYKAIPVPEGEKEPMMNILAYSTPIGVRLVVIPRKRHRPSFYGTEGDYCMLISPASVDMGGVFITPRLQDFERFDADTVRKLIDELCLNLDEIQQIASKVN